jgi:CTP synthase
VNNEYIERLEGCGLFFSGVSSQENLMEIVEMKDHPFFIAVQFHPEFQTSVLKGHPIFNAFIKFIRNSVL